MKYLYPIIILLFSGSYLHAQAGSITGTITDAANGETLIGANVYLEGTLLGSSTDLNGQYLIEDIAPGSYTLIVSFITYTSVKIENLEVKPGESKLIDLSLKENTNNLSEVVVTAKAVQNSENAVLALQRKSAAVQDGVSSQEIIKTGAPNAAESAKQITGTSVVDGKYVYVRGLGDRYTTAQLNGNTLVSTDPYINSAPLDLIPSNLLDNVITIKTATPDNPSNFSGGIVNLTTKDFPERLSIHYSNGISYNPQSSFNNHFLTFDAGKSDWFGFNDGSLAMPEILKNDANLSLLHAPTFYIKARKDMAAAQLLDDASKSLNAQMSPIENRSFTSYNASFSFGNRYKLLHNPLGVIFGFSHSRNLINYENGKNQAWDITGSNAQDLFNYYDLRDHKSIENPVISGIAGLSYRIGEHNEISIISIYNHDTQKLSRYQSGSIPGMVSGSDKVFETRTLQFTERGLSSTQLRGKHHIQAWNNSMIEWSTAYSSSYQNEPDLRFFANENIGDSIYYISVAEYDLPYHYFRYLNDQVIESKIDISIPFLKASNSSNKIKFGFYNNVKSRNFEEFRFYYNNKDGANYQGNQEAYFGAQNVGIIGFDSVYNHSIIGNYLVNDTKISNNYSGSENISSLYLMADYHLSNRLKFIGGLRGESTIMNVESADSLQGAGHIKQFNLFPSANFVYALGDNTNLRVSASQTIARPSMRELAPFVSFDFIGGFIFIGNPELKTTVIKNLDLRWEHFMKAGEVIAVSAYYKHFSNPIVKVYNTTSLNPEIVYQNTNDANVYGLEFDFRKNLGFIAPAFKDFKFNANYSYIFSRVALDSSEYKVLAEINPEIDPYRPFQGQSPFLLNGILSYHSDKLGMGADLSYNLYGKRLSAIGLQGLPDVYDQARGLLNLTLSKKLGNHLSLRFRMNNMLNAEYLTLQTFKSSTYTNESHRLGRTFSFSASYSID